MLDIVASNPNGIFFGNIAVEFIGNPVVIGIDNRIIACGLNFIAKDVDNLSQLTFGETALCGIILNIVGDGVGNRIVLDQVEYKICLFCGFCGIGCTGVNIGSKFYTILCCIFCVGMKLLVKSGLCLSANHNKLNVIL